MTHAISQFMASIDILPDSILLVIICVAAFCIVGLMDERQTKRRARWVPPAARPKPEDKRRAA